MRCSMLTLALLAASASAQVDTAWVRRFNGAGDSADLPAALVASPAGGAWVTGHSFDDDTIEDFLTIHYDGAGATAWYRRYDGRGDSSSRASALAVDDAGNCYVTGKTWQEAGRFDWMTARLDSTGGVLWATYLDGDLHHNDEARAVAVYPGGGCVVTGAAFGPTGNWDFTTVRYGADAETLWTAHYNGDADGADEAEALGIDTVGHIYVAGSSRNAATNVDIVTVKYGGAGETLWARRWTGTGGNAEDKATCLVIDASQSVYVGGYTEGWGTGRDFALVKYSRHGDTLWTRRHNGPGDDDDEVVGIGTDARGRVYACGYSVGDGTFADYLVICYSPLGDSLWARRWDFSGYGNWPTALAVDPDGNCYVTGYGFDPASKYDFHTLSYDPDGSPRWQIRYSGYANDWDQPVGIGLDADRNVYVTGFSMSNAQDFDYVTVKYAQSPGVVEQHPAPDAGRITRGVTVVRGVLRLSIDDCRVSNAELLDAAGRRVMELKAGSNDVSGLAPGVYFVRSASGVVRDAPGVSKVLVQR